MRQPIGPGPHGLRDRRLRTLVLACIAAPLVLLGCNREREKTLEELKTLQLPAQRAAAVSRLAEHVTEDDLPLLLKLAQDPSALVRTAAVKALATFPAPQQVVDVLGELLADPDEEVQAEAVKGLAAIKGDKARAYLLNAYVRRGAVTRAAIGEALGVAGLSDALRHEAKTLWERNLKILETGGGAERIGAAEELGRSGRTEAVERLLPLLGDDSVLLAAGAARGLGASRDRRAVEPLLATLDENYPQLREAAAEALGLLGEPTDVVEALAKLAADGGQVGVPAARALGRLQASEEARTALCRLTVTGSEDVAILAARLMREQGGCPIEPLLTRLNRSGNDLRQALRVLTALGNPDAAAKIATLVGHPEREVRLLAVNALAEFGVGPAPAKLLDLLNEETARYLRATEKWSKQPLPKTFAAGFGPREDAHDHHLSDEEARVKKTRGLLEQVEELKRKRMEAAGLPPPAAREQGDSDLVPDLIGGDTQLASALLFAAGRLKAPEALPVLLKLAADPLEQIRASACAGLGAFGSAESVAAAGRCLDDSSAAVLTATANGLQYGGEAAVEVLIAGLKRRTYQRVDVIRAIGVLRPPNAAAVLIPLLEAGGAESVEVAIALGRLGDRAAVQPLIEHLKDPRTPARLEAIQALALLGDPAAVEAIERELYHERPEVRVEAARAMGALAPGRSGVLEALRFDYYAEVRRAAEQALGQRGGQAAR